jgi:formamidopyrimidine-DNA glycosylase
MPEGPEVKRIVDQMSKVLVGKTLSDVQILSGRYLKKDPDGLANFKNSLPIKITDIKCKGKFIYFLTDGDWNVWNTLGMSGSWIRKEAAAIDAESFHLRLAMIFDDGYVIHFKDIRNFGTIKFSNSKLELDEKIKSLGPDVLSEDISDTLFKSRLKKFGKKTLPEVLMNQSVISGVGNYIKAEALYLAKLSPHRLVSSLSEEDISNLNRAICNITRESYRTGGSTFRTYADFNGEVGNFSSRFMVYGQDTDPLGNEVKREDTKDGRTTHWVPKVQS